MTPVALRGAAGEVTIEVRCDDPESAAPLQEWWRLAPADAATPTDLAFELEVTRDPARLWLARGPAPDGRRVGPGGARALLASADDPYELLLELERALYHGLIQASPLAPLHGAGVALPTPAGEAHLLLGQSGAGKSTLARALVGRGAGYLGDEHLFVDDRGGVSGLVRLIRPEGELAPALPPPAAWVTQPRAVARVVLLRTPRQAGAGLEPLAPAAAAAELAAHLHRRGAADLGRLTRLAARVPAFALACEGVEAAVAALLA